MNEQFLLWQCAVLASLPQVPLLQSSFGAPWLKLLIQIPCFNEERMLGITVAALPRLVPGVASVEYLVIDDGSKDGTKEIARASGVEHIVSFASHQGLSRAFMVGLRECLKANADIVINTDADNQYCADDIEKLIEPILNGKADMVIGARPATRLKSTPALRVLHQIGNSVVSLASGVTIVDATSGFRAMNRRAASALQCSNGYTYTAESLIRACRNGLRVCFVDVRVNNVNRRSRLIKNLPWYILRQAIIILSTWIECDAVGSGRLLRKVSH